jgi:hypothetical protein
MRGSRAKIVSAASTIEGCFATLMAERGDVSGVPSRRRISSS